eukprot:INCI10205.1.p1 GENE.INCI10205.1~~INCI10205.1.p1  ORF type:complete len:337 (+),score=31.61 INCI10205.1:25-1011(+)
MPSCHCKSGRCPKCGSSCKRCGCACDGVSPAAALARAPGRRDAGKRPRMDIRRDCSEDESPGKRSCVETNLPLQSIEDVWKAFGFTKSQRKKLPSKADRSNGHATSTQLAFLVNIVLRTATQAAAILFPGDVTTLLEAVADRIKSNNASVEKQFDRLCTTAGNVLAASPKGSVQRRVSRAILQKGLSRKRQLALDSKIGTSIASSGMTKIRAYADYRTMADGGEITSGTRRISRLPTAPRAPKANRGQPAPIPDGTHVRKPRRGGRISTLPESVSSFLVDAVTQCPTLMPRHGLEQVRAQFQDLPANVTDKQIKRKVSVIKANLKKLS